MPSPPSASPQPDELLAAIDLGSNSFHMVVARLVNDEIRTLEKMGEKVQLAAGLDDNNRLDEPAQERALDCLRRFAQRIQGMPPDNIQVVGTNALRVARNARRFIRRAERILGVPVEVIAGREEARLIYLGVSHTLADDQGRRLVMDIGGGSTEFIIGERFEAQEMESLHMGCVSFRNQYFADGRLSRARMDRAFTHAGQELLNIQRRYRQLGWSSCVGSSGSIKAVNAVIRDLGLSRANITRESMRQLREVLLQYDHVDALAELGVREDRRSIFPAGFAILHAAFEFLDIEEMSFATGALREGLLYDMLGRIRHEDVRERSLQAMQNRYHVDTGHASAVEATACDLLAQVHKAWGLDSPQDEALLRWAARIHEVGLAISHSQYHKHGAYLVRFSDLPGFSLELQEALATLVRLHRRKFNPDTLPPMDDEDERRSLIRLCVLLRLAVLLQHGRNQDPTPPLQIRALPEGLQLHLDDAWLERHPLTRADLENERGYLKRAGLKLEIV